jgi:hypothetical protein
MAGKGNRDRSAIRSRSSHWRNSPLRPILSAASAESGFSGRKKSHWQFQACKIWGKALALPMLFIPYMKTKQVPDDFRDWIKARTFEIGAQIALPSRLPLDYLKPMVSAIWKLAMTHRSICVPDFPAVSHVRRYSRRVSPACF